MWLLYGRLPNTGSRDFSIEGFKEPGEHGLTRYFIREDLLPELVTAEAAQSMSVVGKTLNYI